MTLHKSRRGLVDILTAVGVKGVLIIDPGVPGDECAGGKGGDAFDCLAAGWTQDQTRDWQKRNRILPDELRARLKKRAEDAARAAQEAVEPKTEPEIDQERYEPVYEPANGDHETISVGDDDSPLSPIPLGQDDQTFYYLSRSSGQVHEMTPTGHNKMNLIALAPLVHYWQRTRWNSGGRGKDTIAWDEAADFLMQACYRLPVFDPDDVRGRGVWFDEDQIVLHLGNELMIDGQPRPLDKPNGRYVYPRRRRIRAPANEPLKSKDAAKLRELCRMLSWEVSLSGDLLAGWLVTAVCCGGLRWRPSIWIQGKSGSGKSWLVNNVVKKVLKDRCIVAEGDSSAKGIEQALSGDALPVIYDEAEAEREKDQERIRDIISLMRSAASSSDGRQYKGTIDGSGRSSLTRTCFAFASILPSVTEYADETRVTNLTLLPNGDDAKFAKLKKFAAETLTQDYIDRLFARTIQLLPVIIQNSEIFADAATDILKKRRIGDQIGVFLAGAYSLTSTNVITLEAARKWIADQNWTVHTAINAEQEDQKFLAHLLTKIIPVDGPQGSSKQSSVGELIEMVRYASNDVQISESVARRSLLRIGVRVESSGLYISTTHPEMKSRVFRGTNWHQKKLADLLKMVPGAEKVDKNVRFGPSFSGPAFEIPFSVLDERYVHGTV